MGRETTRLYTRRVHAIDVPSFTFMGWHLPLRSHARKEWSAIMRPRRTFTSTLSVELISAYKFGTHAALSKSVRKYADPGAATWGTPPGELYRIPGGSHLVTIFTELPEIDSVVDYLRKQTGRNKIFLAGWSRATNRFGLYAGQHPDKVERLAIVGPCSPTTNSVGTFSCFADVRFHPASTSADRTDGLKPANTGPRLRIDFAIIVVHVKGFRTATPVGS